MRLSGFKGAGNVAEVRFARTIDAQAKTWLHQPRSFALRIAGQWCGYQPDFYVLEDGCFYEVCGTRMAYSYQREKINAFRQQYPYLPLKVVNIGAWKIGPREYEEMAALRLAVRRLEVAYRNAPR